MPARRHRLLAAAGLALSLTFAAPAPAQAAWCAPGGPCAAVPLACASRVGLLLTWHAAADQGSWWYRVVDGPPAPPGTTAPLHAAALPGGRTVLVDLRDASVRGWLSGALFRAVTVEGEHGALRLDEAGHRVELTAGATLLERRRWFWQRHAKVTRTPVSCTASYQLPS